MRTIYDATFAELDISTTVDLLEFTIPDQNMSIISMINLSDLSGQIGEYDSKVYLDGHLAVPDRKILSMSGMTSISLQSRNIAVYQNAVVKITLKGLDNDNNVKGRLLLLDASTFTSLELESLFDELSLTLSNQVIAAVKGLSITVKPETKILGPCKERITILNQCPRTR